MLFKIYVFNNGKWWDNISRDFFLKAVNWLALVAWSEYADSKLVDSV